ncbi:MAG TPA: VCBS repeat-containing protein [Thermoanaerobaculia bacterium]
MRRALLLFFLLSLPAAAQRRGGACAFGIDAPRVYAALSYSRLFVADFDGDGRADVGAAGTAKFEIRKSLGGGALSEPYSVALRVIDVGDLAGDALPDLLLHGCSIAENRGDGTFAAPRAVAGASGRHLIGDFTGGGKEDLLFLSTVGNTLTLHGREPQFLPEPVQAMALANVNGDAIQDLFLLNAGGRTVSVWRGTASGTFEYVEVFVTDGLATRVVAADLDGDGKTEAIAVMEDHLEVLGRGHRVARTPQWSTGVEAHDFDGNGTADLIVDGVIFVSEGGLLRPATPVINTSLWAPITAGDFTGDGAAELVVPTGSGYAIVPPFARAPLPLPENVQGSGHVIADVNGDALDDFVFSRDRAVHVAMNDGGGGFTLETLPAQYRVPIFGTAQNEIAVIEGNDYPRKVDVFGRVNGVWQRMRTVVDAPEAVSARTADLDGDGVTETIVIENTILSGPIPRFDDYRLKVFSGSTGALLLERDDWSYKVEVETADLNADGVADLVIVDGGKPPTAMRPWAVRDGLVQVLHGVTGGGLGVPVTVAVKVLPRAPRTGDFNGDGRRDLAYLDDWALVAHYGTAGGFTAPQPVTMVGPYASLLDAYDLNGDGMTDLMATGSAELTLAVGSKEGLVDAGLFYRSLGVPMRLRANGPPSRVLLDGTVAEVDSDCRPTHRRAVRH